MQQVNSFRRARPRLTLPGFHAKEEVLRFVYVQLLEQKSRLGLTCIFVPPPPHHHQRARQVIITGRRARDVRKGHLDT